MQHAQITSQRRHTQVFELLRQDCQAATIRKRKPDPAVISDRGDAAKVFQTLAVQSLAQRRPPQPQAHFGTRLHKTLNSFIA